jgi:hypothetical protein
LSPDGRFALSGSHDNTVRLWELDWEFEPNQPADWDEGARPYLNAFLILHSVGQPPAQEDLGPLDERLDAIADILGGLYGERALDMLDNFKETGQTKGSSTHELAAVAWTEEDFRRLLDRLGCAGYGWLRPEGVRRELEKLAANWQGPPSLA